MERRDFLKTAVSGALVAAGAGTAAASSDETPATHGGETVGCGTCSDPDHSIARLSFDGNGQFECVEIEYEVETKDNEGEVGELVMNLDVKRIEPIPVESVDETIEVGPIDG